MKKLNLLFFLLVLPVFGQSNNFLNCQQADLVNNNCLSCIPGFILVNTQCLAISGGSTTIANPPASTSLLGSNNGQNLGSQTQTASSSQNHSFIPPSTGATTVQSSSQIPNGQATSSSSSSTSTVSQSPFLPPIGSTSQASSTAQAGQPLVYQTFGTNTQTGLPFIYQTAGSNNIGILPVIQPVQPTQPVQPVNQISIPPTTTSTQTSLGANSPQGVSYNTQPNQPINSVILGTTNPVVANSGVTNINP